MRIASSAVAMSSDRQYACESQFRMEERITTADVAATLEFSKEGGDLLKQLEENEKRAKAQRKEQQERALADAFTQRNQQSKKVEQQETAIKSPEDLQLEILRKMLAALKRLQSGKNPGETFDEIKDLQKEFKRTRLGQTHVATGGQASFAGEVVQVSTAPRVPTQWVKTTVTSSFFCETENTAYQATGIAKTTDGRELSFGVTVEMSRAFCEKYESFVQEDYVCVDPLVINVDASVASVTDQKFLFDLDSDGQEEQISFAGAGSGFLALDKNRDGKIGDGSELFGTQSGNGFADLAKYDEDGNGWIDEGDSVFADLKVWTKDENGNDKLIGLKKADVGAIYLGYAETEFSLNELETNKKNGIIRSTGVFLKESGGVGTVQHLDLVV
ncbi:MAG: hypothetical protein IJ282_09745 [Lachnospiraceae bacterium]|nr:hypothetical protein [Lachnospiraceae bacterium]